MQFLNSLDNGRKIYLKHGVVAANEIYDPTDKLFNVYRTSQEFEKITSTTGMPFATPRNEGGTTDEVRRRKLYSIDVYPEEFRLKWRETWQGKKFDPNGKVAENPSLAGRMIKHTRIRALTNKLNNGFTGGSYVGPDGVALFSASHPTNGGPTYSNLATSAAMSEATVLLALQQLRALADPNGAKMATDMMSYLVHPINKIGEAVKIAESTKVPGAANNDTNEVMNRYIEPVCLDYLNDDAWFIVSRDKKQHTLSVLRRQPMYTHMTRDEEGDYVIVMGEEWATFHENGYGLIGNAGV